MKVHDLQAYLETEFTYPIEQQSVIDRIGADEIEAPDAAETETVSAIIEPVGQERYRSAEELYTTIVGNVSDEYVGRKFYDDRGGDGREADMEPRDDVDVSF